MSTNFMIRAAGLVAMLPSCLVLSHSSNETGNMYDTAYRYIETSQVLKSYCREFHGLEPEQCVVAVADSTVFMEYSMYARSFAEEIGGGDELAVLEYIMQRDRERERSFVPVSIIEELSVDTRIESAPLRLYFSDPLENALMARVLGAIDARTSYREMTQFNTGVTFLFFFNDEGKITRVVESVTQYN